MSSFVRFCGSRAPEGGEAHTIPLCAVVPYNIIFIKLFKSNSPSIKRASSSATSTSQYIAFVIYNENKFCNYFFYFPCLANIFL